jgi:apolipoprotein N-acyltransferase
MTGTPSPLAQRRPSPEPTRSVPSWARRALPSLLLAVGGGVVWAFAFGRQGMLVAPWLALAPLPLLLGRRRPTLLALLWGVTYWLTAIPWIAYVLRRYGELPWALAVFCLLLLAGYLALFPALFAGLGARLWRISPARRGGTFVASLLVPLFALPALWVALEWLRAHLFSGFPWNLAGYAWVEVPGALPLSAWVGVYGISYLVLFANTGVALAVDRRRWEPAALGVLLPLILLAAGGRWGAGQPLWTGPEPEPVRIVQPNIENELRPQAATVTANYRKVLRLLDDSCEPGALVVLPESSFWPFVYARDAQLKWDLRRRLEAERCSLLFNSVEPVGERGAGASGGYYNSVYLLDPSGLRGRYDKRHLVPFGEYVPLSGVFSFLDAVARNAGGFVPGDAVTLLPWGRERLGVAVCFEITFPADVAELVRAGATLLVTVTNDAWYGDTWAPWQHLRAARFRAAESRRPVLRAAITGVSALIRADGSLLASVDLYRESVIRGRVQGRLDLSPVSRRPWAVPLLCSVVAALALGFAIIPGRR